MRDALLRQNTQTPGGNVTTPTRESSLRTLGRLTDPAEFGELVLATRNATPIRVRDVGWAEDGTKEQRSVARLDDVPTVILEVRRQSGANTVAVIEAAQENLAILRTQLPSDVRLEIIRDQSRYIYAALHEITRHLVLGSVLACLVVLSRGRGPQRSRHHRPALRATRRRRSRASRQLARLEPAATASRIDRLDRQRVASIRATVAPGYALGDRLEAVRAAAAELGLPPGYSTGVSGRGRELERTFGEFIWAFLLSIAFMYMILAAQYESLVDPVTILLSLPLAIPFALFSLWLAGNTLNLYSALGILVLFGVVKKNSILQIDHIKQLRAAGLDRTAAIIQGSRDRLRPILMTTLTLVAGMLPLALGTGPGAEERYTIAVVVIGGQSLSLLLTLVVTPVAYAIFDDLGAAVPDRLRELGLRRATSRPA